MALDFSIGALLTGTGAAGTKITVAGLSFQPKVVIFLWGGLLGIGHTETHHRFSMGFMAGATSRGGQCSRSTNASAASVSAHRTYDDAAIRGTTVGEGAADFDAFLSDGFRLVVDDPFPASFLVFYLALGGSDLTDVASAVVTMPSSALPPGDADVQDVNVGFRPDCILALGSSSTFNTEQTDSKFVLGVAAGADLAEPVNAIFLGNSFGFSDTTDTWSYCRRGGLMLSNVLASTLNGHARVVRFLEAGFRLMWSERAPVVDPLQFVVLALKGPRFHLGFSETLTGPGGFKNKKSEQMPFKPTIVLAASHNKTESVFDVVQPNDERSIGIGFAPDPEVVVGVLDKDNVATTDIGVSQSFGSFYINQSLDATIVEEGRANLLSFDSDPGFTFYMSDGDPLPAFFWYLAMAGQPVAGPAGAFALHDSQIPLLQFETPATPWAPVWWGGPASMLFNPAAAAAADLATKMLSIPATERQMSGITMISGG